MKQKANSGGDTARRIGKMVAGLWIALNIWMSVKLLLEDRYSAAIGWLIILAISLFFAYLSFFLPRKIPQPRDQAAPNRYDIKRLKSTDALVLLLATKDHVRVAQVKEALSRAGVNCVVLDEHSAAMMSFLPDVEMRVMVFMRDFDSSVAIVEDLNREKDSQGVRQVNHTQ